MADTSQIRDHMEVADETGRRVGTVDSVEGGRIKLTRNDSSDGEHHYLDAADVDRIEGGRVILRAGADAGARQTENATAGNAGNASEAEIAAASSYHAKVDSPLNGPEDRPLFGTSGTGTGMGGSGAGEH